MTTKETTILTYEEFKTIALTTFSNSEAIPQVWEKFKVEPSQELLDLREMKEQYEWTLDAIPYVCDAVKFWRDMAIKLQEEE